ncbi:MAG: hypothetical protein RL348_1374 [Bacteroidota bacterium]|jgi:hypothetical protein
MNSVSNHGKKIKMLRFNKEQKYICFDFETCHLNLLDLENKPWQLSYLIAEGTNIIHQSDNYIKWNPLNMSQDAIAITHFSYDRYNYLAKDPEPILNEFEKYLYDPNYLIVGQNLLGFDVYIHNIYRKLLGRKSDFSFTDRILDTNCIAKAIKKNFKVQNRDELIYWQYKLNDFREKGLKTSIKAQLKEYKIDFDENMLHNSMYDVQMNFKIFTKQLWQVEI